ncbi:MAG: DUF1579 family protein [Phycisphaerae bacterium]|nr:DUF1579 family protein [Phycisphaerae bacterium]
MRGTIAWIGIGMSAGIIVGWTCGASPQPPRPTTVAPPASAGPKPTPPDPSTLVETLERESRPGEEHRRLGVLIGEWDARGSFWTSPGSEPIVSEGRANGAWILGERFLRFETSVRVGGRPGVDSLAIFGYDTRLGRATVYSIDTWASYGMFASGPRDDDRVSWSLEGESFQPGVGSLRFRWIIREENPGRVVMEAQAPLEGGEWFTASRTEFTRRP